MFVVVIEMEYKLKLGDFSKKNKFSILSILLDWDNPEEEAFFLIAIFHLNARNLLTIFQIFFSVSVSFSVFEVL